MEEIEKIKTLDDVLKLEPDKEITTKQLQNIYKITGTAMGYSYDDKNDLTDNQLKRQIARNLYDLYCFLSYNAQEKKQQCLDKSCKFNDLIFSDCTKAEIEFINRTLRIPLVKKLIEVNGQENLDKAYEILQQVSENSEGISFDELKGLASDLLVKYEELNLDQDKIQFLEEKLEEIEEMRKTKEKMKDVLVELKKIVPIIDDNVVNAPVIQEDKLEEELKNSFSTEEELNEVLEEQRQQTHLRHFNPELSRDFDLLFNELKQSEPKRSKSVPMF